MSRREDAGTRVARIQTFKEATSAERQDLLAVEEPLEIRIVYQDDFGPVEQRASITMRTPGQDEALAVGFLFTEGIIHDADAIERIESGVDSLSDNVLRVLLKPTVDFDPGVLQRNFYTTSSCGVCGKASIEAIQVTRARPLHDVSISVTSSLVHSLPEQLAAAQSVFSKTGGLHAAGLFDARGALLSLHEDVGRHNALDKLIGEELLAGNVPLNQRILMVSGRTSFEILQKAVVAGIPVVAAVSAPSSLAVQLAWEFGVTLLGFVRDNRFNIYAGQHRMVKSAP